jgi:hypothetical protein
MQGSLDTDATPKPAPAKHGGESDHDKGRADELQLKKRSNTFRQLNPARIIN